MRKGVSFVSVVLTTFILSLVAGVVYAYNGLMTKPDAPQTGSQVDAQSPANVQPMSMPFVASTATGIPNLSPQDAAYQASQYLNQTDLYSVELADVGGVQAYKVTFSSGNIVYINMQGQVLGMETPPPPVVITAAGGGGGGRKGKSSGGGGGQGGGENEGHDD